MTVLRVLLAAAPAADRAENWALFDAGGACVRKGRDLSAAWPQADRLEIVLAASQSRIAVIALPPMPASRVAGAAGFALEDQLAGPNADHYAAVSAQAPDGRVRITIASQSLLARIVGHGANVARIVAEPDLAPPAADWQWCAGESSASGFVRRPDGSAFPVDAPATNGILPPELVMALAQARRGNAAPFRVRVDAPFDPSSLGRWQRDTGVEFVRGTPWHWESASPAAYAGALDLLPRPSHGTTASTQTTLGRLLAPALVVAGLALGLHVVASTIEWAALNAQAWRDAKEWATLAATAGVPPDLAATPAAARVALARRYADVRHAQGLRAPDDALPLLARAAPVLAGLPAGVVKSATYADGHWTLDLARVDAEAAGAIDRRLRAVGVPALMAASPNGVRLRLGGS
jgi:hypothetical protein